MFLGFLGIKPRDPRRRGVDRHPGPIRDGEPRSLTGAVGLSNDEKPPAGVGGRWGERW